MPDTDQLTQEIQDLARRVDAAIADMADSAPGYAALRCTEDLLRRAANAAAVAAGRLQPSH